MNVSQVPDSQLNLFPCIDLVKFGARAGLAAALLILFRPALATEGGGSNYTPGFYGDLGMAVMPDEGIYFYNFFAGYGDRGGNSGTLLEMPGILLSSNQHILGGRYIAALFPAVTGVIDDTGTHGQARVGLGDAYIIPFGLNWQLGKIAVTVFEGIVAPTGRYTKGALNTGRNNWTFDHLALLTWSLPAQNELSLALGYMNNTANPATHYQSGDELHFDYTLGHYLADNLGFGFTGSYYKQLTGDHAPERLGGTRYSELAALGPVILFSPRIGGKDVTLSLKWLHEFNVTGRPPQNYLVWRLLVSF